MALHSCLPTGNPKRNGFSIACSRAYRRLLCTHWCRNLSATGATVPRRDPHGAWPFINTRFGSGAQNNRGRGLGKILARCRQTGDQVRTLLAFLSALVSIAVLSKMRFRSLCCTGVNVAWCMARGIPSSLNTSAGSGQNFLPLSAMMIRLEQYRPTGNQVRIVMKFCNSPRSMKIMHAARSLSSSCTGETVSR